MDHHRYVAHEETEGIGRFFIVYLIDVLYYDKMVARSECALLRPSPLIGFRTDQAGIGSGSPGAVSAMVLLIEYDGQTVTDPARADQIVAELKKVSADPRSVRAKAEPLWGSWHNRLGAIAAQ